MVRSHNRKRFLLPAPVAIRTIFWRSAAHQAVGGSVSMPDQGGRGGPSCYASSPARRPGTTGASTPSPLREISGQASPDRNASSGRSDLELR
jgi:hypothetical protein